MKIYPVDLKRFNSYVLISDGGCHVWMGTRTVKGYGAFNLRGRNMGAHRFALLKEKIDVPPGHCVVHRCGRRVCVYPGHLEVITWGEATRRALERKAEHGTRGDAGVK